MALLIPATLFGWASMGVAVLIHEGATILVVLNGEAARLGALPQLFMVASATASSLAETVQ